MHSGRNLAPLHRKARAVCAENGIRRIFQITLRVIGKARKNVLRIMAVSVSARLTQESSASAGIGSQLGGIAVHRRRGRAAAQKRPIPQLLRRIKAARAGADIRNGAADLFRRHRQPKGDVWLQKPRLCLHQPLPHRAIGRLPEVAALSMLEVRPACGQRNFHIR